MNLMYGRISGDGRKTVQWSVDILPMINVLPGFFCHAARFDRQKSVCRAVCSFRHFCLARSLAATIASRVTLFAKFLRDEGKGFRGKINIKLLSTVTEFAK